MNENCKKLFDLLVRVFMGLLLLYLISLIPFTIIIFQDSGEGIPYAYILARVLRIVLGIALCWVIRNRTRKALTFITVRRIWLEVIILGILVVSIFLFLCGAGDKFYYTITDVIGLYPLSRAPVFLAILWEQLFSIDFFWSILLGIAILLFPISAKHADKSVSK